MNRMLLTMPVVVSLIARVPPVLGGDLAVPPANEGPATEESAMHTEGCPNWPGQNCNGIDVMLGQLYGFSHQTRLGTYPNGETGFSAATTSCNNGVVRVPWFAPMNVNHPGITINLFRLAQGRLTHIGGHWMKHGFTALASNQCGFGCEGCGGTQLCIGCSDTYGAGTNASRTYLGPRKEWNPFTGVWNCVGSHFSGGMPDCTRRHSSSGHAATDHYTRVADQDLLTPGAQYFYDGYYVVRDDLDLHNSVGYKSVTFSWNGSSWSASSSGSTTPPTYGVILNPNVWGDEHVLADTTGEGGEVHLAVKTTDNGNGTWHFEYAVYNLNYHRRVRSFSVPKSAGTNITNIGFHGPPLEEQSQTPWTVTVDASSCTWATDTYNQDPNANAIIFGSLYNFWFDADAEPAPSEVSMEPFLPAADDGALTVLTASITGPSAAGGPCGDFDGDGDVDLTDFTQFQLCFGGSNNPPAATCPPGVDADCDGDGDVDLADFLVFQQNFTGSM